MISVVVLLNIPSDFIPQAKYVFNYFGNSWGLPVDIIFDKNGEAPIHVLYGFRNEALSLDGAVFIPFDASLYDQQTVCTLCDCDGFAALGKAGTPDTGIDLVASTFRLLTMVDEHQIDSASRDKLGNFFVDALPEGRRRSIDLPLVDYYAAFLLDKLLALTPELRSNILPRWPHGKKFAVCLTHDSDLIHMGSPIELATAMVKGFVRRKRVFFDMALEGVRYLHSPMNSSLWGFSGWAEYEMDHNIRSCFYLPVSPRKSKRRLNDCKSDVFVSGVDWKVFQSMQKQGWEFGLHPSLDAQKDLEEIVLQKMAVEERLQAPLMGLRHHYLAIDNQNPHLTFEKHVAAGFSYDTSLGWQEKAGFRTGTSLPFRPYDPVRKRAFQLIELPLALMDTYVMGQGDVEVAIKAGRRIAKLICDVGGLININWHTETHCSKYIFLNYLTGLKNILEPLLKDNDAWVTTPMQIAEWWNYRNKELQRNVLGMKNICVE